MAEITLDDRVSAALDPMCGELPGHFGWAPSPADGMLHLVTGTAGSKSTTLQQGNANKRRLKDRIHLYNLTESCECGQHNGPYGVELAAIREWSATVYKFLLLPGDGIGPEIIDATRRVMDWFQTNRAFAFEAEDALLGGIAYEKLGRPDPDETIEKALNADAVLLGAVGGPQWDNLAFDLRPERGLLRLRKDMGVFANLRPALCFEALKDASTLKPEIVSGLDILIVRELMGGVYFGTPKERTTLPDGRTRAIDTQVYTSDEIDRVARAAFDLARQRRGHVTSVEKSNVMMSGALWRQVVSALHAEHYPDIELNHMLADSCAMQLVRSPKQFDVIVTDNLFGDVLSDEAAQLTGSIGMLPSASLGATGKAIRSGLYEPIHGSAPDIAGKDLANPIATILSFSMCLQYSFSRDEDAALLNQAVAKTLEKGYRTADIMQPNMTKVGTDKMTDLILKSLNELRDAAP